MTDIFVGTFTVALSDDRILISAHGLANNEVVRFEVDDPATCALPTPLGEGYYHVVGARGNDFQVSSSESGPVINLTDKGIGSNEVWKKGSGTLYYEYKLLASSYPQALTHCEDLNAAIRDGWEFVDWRDSWFLVRRTVL